MGTNLANCHVHLDLYGLLSLNLSLNAVRWTSASVAMRNERCGNIDGILLIYRECEKNILRGTFPAIYLFVIPWVNAWSHRK